MSKKKIAITALAFIALAAFAALWLTPDGLQPAPEVRFSLIDGGELPLTDLKGKPVLVTFWATSCPSCIKEMPHLVDLHNKLAGTGFTLIGVAMSYDDPKLVEEMRKTRGLPYQIAYDADGSIAERFGGVMLTPTSVLISPAGRIAYRKLGEMDMTQVERLIRDMLPS